MKKNNGSSLLLGLVYHCSYICKEGINAGRARETTEPIVMSQRVGFSILHFFGTFSQSRRADFFLLDEEFSDKLETHITRKHRWFAHGTLNAAHYSHRL